MTYINQPCIDQTSEAHADWGSRDSGSLVSHVLCSHEKLLILPSLSSDILWIYCTTYGYTAYLDQFHINNISTLN